MKILIVAGARPNFMKIAPIISAIGKHNSSMETEDAKISYRIVHTGQHYDVAMSEVFFRDLGLPDPDINLEVGSASHAVQTANIMIRFEEVCLDEKPDWVIVVGDVNSTMACTLVAVKLGIKVGHVEAGLRSFDRSMPEEINRIVTDALADLLFTPSSDADDNLRCEGIPNSKIRFVGNIMIDSLLSHLGSALQRKAYERFGVRPHSYAVVTLHRPANVDSPEFLNKFMGIIADQSRALPIIFPVHPRTRSRLAFLGYQQTPLKEIGILLVEPLGYLDFISLLAYACLAVTDSGGIQEETTYLKVPCLTLRSTTERPVTITLGTNKLTSLEALESDIAAVVRGNCRKGSIPELWDGQAGRRIIECCCQYGCGGDGPEQATGELKCQD